MENILYQSHAGSWAIMVLLFIVAFILLKRGHTKGQKITQMILRLFYIIMVVTGVGMLISYKFPLIYIVKGILAIWLIAVMELILARSGQETAQGASTGSYWVQLVISLIIVVLIGFNVISF